jgi:hypothetical protein
MARLQYVCFRRTPSGDTNAAPEFGRIAARRRRRHTVQAVRLRTLCVRFDPVLTQRQ